MQEQLIDFIKKLVAAIEGASIIVWESAIRQSTITGVYYFVGLLLTIAIMVILIYIQLKMKANITGLNAGDYIPGMVVLFGIMIVDVSVLMYNLYWGMTYGLNPEWGAILILKNLAGL